MYLSAIQDLNKNEIIVYHVSEQNDLSLVMKALEKASKNRDVTGTLIHSDQEHQYMSPTVQQKLEQLEIISEAIQEKETAWIMYGVLLFTSQVGDAVS